MTLVGVYVDDLLVTAIAAALVQLFSFCYGLNSNQGPWEGTKFLGMRIELDERNGYTFDQQATKKSCWSNMISPMQIKYTYL